MPNTRNTARLHVNASPLSNQRAFVTVINSMPVCNIKSPGFIYTDRKNKSKFAQPIGEKRSTRCSAQRTPGKPNSAKNITLRTYKHENVSKKKTGKLILTPEVHKEDPTFPVGTQTLYRSGWMLTAHVDRLREFGPTKRHARTRKLFQHLRQRLLFFPALSAQLHKPGKRKPFFVGRLLSGIEATVEKRESKSADFFCFISLLVQGHPPLRLRSRE